MVELGVVKAVQEVDRSRPGRGEADAHLTGPLRVAAGHERRHLLMARLDELDLLLVAVERPDGRVDPVAGITVDPVDAPLGEAIEHEVRGRLGHCRSFRSRYRGGPCRASASLAWRYPCATRGKPQRSR